MSDLHFQSSTGSLTVAILLALAIVIISARNLVRNSFTWRMCLLEGLRVLIVAFLIVTLFQPEKVTRHKRDVRPEIIVLADQSGSMKTLDLYLGDTVQAREEWVKRILSEQFYAPFEADSDVHVA